MSIISIEEPRVTTNGNGHASAERRRVLVFDGNDAAVTAAAPALVGLGIEVSRCAARSAPLRPSPHDVLAVVASSPTGDTQRTTELIRHLRAACGLPVLLLAPRPQDDVLLQEMPVSHADGG